jgi:hypothetical protein
MACCEIRVKMFLTYDAQKVDWVSAAAFYAEADRVSSPEFDSSPTFLRSCIQPVCEVSRCDDIVEHAEPRPPCRHTGICDHIAVKDIHDAMRCEGHDNNPWRMFEPGNEYLCENLASRDNNRCFRRVAYRTNYVYR